MMTLTQYLQSHASDELASTLGTLANSSIAISALLDKGRWRASTAKQVTKIFKAKPKNSMSSPIIYYLMP